jgi:hypothetical protein
MSDKLPILHIAIQFQHPSLVQPESEVLYFAIVRGEPDWVTVIWASDRRRWLGTIGDREIFFDPKFIMAIAKCPGTGEIAEYFAR